MPANAVPPRKKFKEPKPKRDDDDDDDDKPKKKGDKSKIVDKEEKKEKREVEDEEKETAPSPPVDTDVEMRDVSNVDPVGDELRRQAIQNQWEEKKKKMREQGVRIPEDVEMLELPDPPPEEVSLPPEIDGDVPMRRRRRVPIGGVRGIDPKPGRGKPGPSKKRERDDDDDDDDPNSRANKEKKAMSLLVQQRLDQLQGKKPFKVPAATQPDVDRSIVHELRDNYRDEVREQAARQGLRLPKRSRSELEDGYVDELPATRRRIDDDDDEDDLMLSKSIPPPPPPPPPASRRPRRRRPPTPMPPRPVKVPVSYDDDLPPPPPPGRRQRETPVPVKGVKRPVYYDDDSDYEHEDASAMRRLKTALNRGVKRAAEDEITPSTKRQFTRGRKRIAEDELASLSKRHHFDDGEEDLVLPRGRPTRRLIKRPIVPRKPSPVRESEAVKRKADEEIDDIIERELKSVGLPYKRMYKSYVSESSDEVDSDESE